MNIHERIVETEKVLREISQESLDIMLRKNKERGDCFRATGLVAQFIDIHGMYNRLRNLIWEMGPPDSSDPEWEAAVLNALQDMRNFTMLAEISLKEENWDGRKYYDPELPGVS